MVGGAVPVACNSVVAVGVAVGDMVGICVLVCKALRVRVGGTVAKGAENVGMRTEGRVSEGWAVAVSVGVPVGNWVEVGIVVGKVSSVAWTVAEGTGIGDGAGMQAPMVSMRMPTTSTVRLIISLSPFSRPETVYIVAVKPPKSL